MRGHILRKWLYFVAAVLAVAYLGNLLTKQSSQNQSASADNSTQAANEDVAIVAVCADLSGGQQHLGYGLGLLEALASQGMQHMLQVSAWNGYSSYCGTGSGPDPIGIREIKANYSLVADYLDEFGRGAFLVRPTGTAGQDSVLLMLSK